MKIPYRVPVALIPAALLGLASVQAVAQEPAHGPFYLGVGIGQARLNRDSHLIEPVAGSDSGVLGWKLRFGYEFSPYVAVEAAFADFGEYDTSEAFAIPAEGSNAATDYVTSAQAMGLSVLGRLPIGERFHLTGIAGLLRREFKTTYHLSATNLLPRHFTDGDLGYQLGLGFGVTLHEGIDLDLEWFTTRNLEGDYEFATNAADPSLLSLGVRFKL